MVMTIFSYKYVKCTCVSLPRPLNSEIQSEFHGSELTQHLTIIERSSLSITNGSIESAERMFAKLRITDMPIKVTSLFVCSQCEAFCFQLHNEDILLFFLLFYGSRSKQLNGCDWHRKQLSTVSKKNVNLIGQFVAFAWMSFIHFRIFFLFQLKHAKNKFDLSTKKI